MSFAFDVFLSHNSRDKPTVRQLGEALKRRGLRVWLDEWELVPGRPWLKALEEVIETTRAAAVLVGKDGLGPWQEPEMHGCISELVNRKLPVIPVLLPGAPRKPKLPLFLKQFTWVDLREGITEAGLNRLVWGIKGEKPRYPNDQPSKPRRSSGQERISFPATGPEVEISRLPVTGEILVGREDKVARLDNAWDDDRVHVLSLVAPGGVGKTALVNRWLDAMAAVQYRGATRVMSWSFYSQGTDEDRVASADAFIDDALRTLGDEDPSAGTPRDRGVRLARLLRRERTLLILDGVEPLQHPPDSPVAGRLKDPALAALLKELAGRNPGLCVVTTRETIVDLANFAATAPRIDLEELTPEAGAELLRLLGVRGTDGELRTAAEEYKGHALALTLLGNYLRKARAGDVRCRAEVPLGTADQLQGGHAYRVMAAYERWLGSGPELGILRLMGLFDRPAAADAVSALRSPPEIPDLTERLVGLPEDQWQHALSNLREHGLLARSGNASNVLDAHPLVRSYFADQLRKQHPEAWRGGNLRLYEHLRVAAPDLPDTLDQMMPLFTAVVHGCRAGRQQEALDEGYLRRIQRHPRYFSTQKLGAWCAELTALSGFFHRPWKQPSSRLDPASQAFVLNAAGFRLRTIGRLTEALEPLQAAVTVSVSESDWENAARYSGSLSELYLTLGDVPAAVREAEHSVRQADRSGVWFQRMSKRTTLADALHQAGRLDDSAAAFTSAEAMQAQFRPQYPKLYSLWAYRYHDFLLGPLPCVYAGSDTDEKAEVRRMCQVCQEVLERVKQVSAWRQSPDSPLSPDSLLDVAFDHLSLGRAHLGLALTASADARDDRATELTKAEEYLAAAIDGLRQVAREDFLPGGLIARASVRRACGNMHGADADLREALEIAERGQMRLHECDVHIEWARLALSGVRTDEARCHYDRARELVEKLGYGRRHPELEELASIIGDH